MPEARSWRKICDMTGKMPLIALACGGRKWMITARMNRTGIQIGLWLACTLSAVEVKPPAAIETRGVPVISDKLAARVQPYLNVRAVRLQDVAPDSKRMLITQRPKDGQVAQLHEMRAAGAKPIQLTNGREPVRSAQYHPVHGRSVIFLRDTGGSERFQVFHLDLTTGKETRLTDGRSRHTRPRWSPDGKQVAYFSPKRNGRDNDLYLTDPAKVGSERLHCKLKGGGWWMEDWQASGELNLMLLMEYRSITDSELHIVDAQTGELSSITPDLKAEIQYQNARFDPQLRAIYYSCDEDADFQHIIRFSLRTGERKALEIPSKWDVEALAVSPNGRTLAVVHNEAGASRLGYFGSSTGEPVPQQALHRKLPTGVLRKIQWLPDGSGLAYDLDSTRSPGDLRVEPMGKRDPVNWAVSDLGKLNPAKLSEPRRMTVSTIDGLKFEVWVYQPGRWVNEKFDPISPPFKGFPALIHFHGGPESQFRPRFQGRRNYFMSEENIMLLCPNIRGSRGYGKRFLKADNGVLRRKVLIDMEHLYNIILKSRDLDSDRIGVMGGSYGGFMVLHSMVYLNSFIKCGVDVVGISNFITFLKHTSEYRRDLRRAEYGDERDPMIFKFLKDLSPYNHSKKITRPLLIVQGANDPRVPASESLQMERALRKQGVETWFMMAANEGHGFRRRENRNYQFLTTVAFLRKHLLGKDDATQVPPKE